MVADYDVGEGGLIDRTGGGVRSLGARGGRIAGGVGGDGLRQFPVRGTATAVSSNHY